jgi:hypothetical protein
LYILKNNNIILNLKNYDNFSYIFEILKNTHINSKLKIYNFDNLKKSINSMYINNLKMYLNNEILPVITKGKSYARCINLVKYSINFSKNNLKYKIKKQDLLNSMLYGFT